MTSAPVARKNPAPPVPSGASASPLRGILFLIASTIVFSVADVITKQLASTLPPPEVAWMRYVTFALVIIPVVLMNGGPALLRSQRPSLQVLRGLGMVGSSIMFIQSLPHLPVADATAIFFVSPILIMALSVLFLGESVGWRRWSAAAIGLIGVMIVVRPGAGTFQPAAFLPIISASSWAVGAVVTRKITGDQALTTLAYSASVGSLVLSALMPFHWVTPNGTEIALGLCMGVLFAIGHGFVVLAYRQGNASLIAPFSYVQLIWAGTLGYLVFGSLPDSWTVAGAGLIAVSGFYTAYRERVRAMQKKFSA
ncbi:DMT family transporter [Microvirga sp. HBU67558]|uniref:DMT family transporter n=1 Tax=Microvirga TaxID=186650 RepID=UPI001B375CFB|nr:MULTISPECIES: DMT family transporter [unclassified Microvirga]MBQ0821341.1 DMT family transporter [Microvirga sp. HBU67558]